MLQIRALESVVHELSRLPGIGPKTAQRLAYYILRSENNYVDQLCKALIRMKSEVHTCLRCFNFTDKDLCWYCENPHRNGESICVVEEPSDIMRIESSGAFRGHYHVLHGVISPLEGVGPDDIKINELIHRVENSMNGVGPQIQEIIFALDADLEGDTTVLYLTKILQNKNLKLSRIAHGVPIGSDIDFVDERTMGRALENRVEL